MTWTSRVISTLLLISAPASAQSPSSAQWSKEAQEQKKAPSKIAIEAPTTSPRVGDPLDVFLKLVNDNNEQTSAQKDTPIKLQMVSESGEVVQTKSCVISTKSTSTKCTLAAPATGIFKVKALPENRDLLDSTQYVLVRPKPEQQPQPAKTPPKGGRVMLFPTDAPHSRIIRAGYTVPESEFTPVRPEGGGCDAPVSHSAAQVVVLINPGGEVGEAFRAGIDSATITAFFKAEDNGSAPTAIKVWLSPDHGAIEGAPITIPGCRISGSARLTSRTSVQVTVTFQVYPTPYQPTRATPIRANFITPIVGIGIVPLGKQVMSLIDRAPIIAEFYDDHGFPVKTDIPRRVNFISNNAVIGPKSQSVDVQAGKDAADNLVLPYWVGAGLIYVSSEHLKSADPHPVEVTALAVLIVCLIGGLLGGLVAYYNAAGGKVVKQLLSGVAGSIVFSWLYVFGIAGKVDWGIAHNAASVFVFALLGGYLGVKALDFALSKIGGPSATGQPN